MKASCHNSMMKFVLALVLVMSCGAMAFAQSTTDGAIGGTVYDISGAVVGQATIVVHNNGTNAEETTTSDASGYYRVAHLQPGSYTVTITHEGLAQYKAQQVIVQVGSLTEVSPRLGVKGAEATIEVTAEAPQINYTSPEFAPTLNQEAISNLPINGGRWSSFAILTPGVVSDSNGFGLLSFRGISTLLNNNTIDGADNNQAFFSEERGRTRIGYSTPKAAVGEFQVNTSNYSAEYGRSAGGVVNTVTKSGTNQIHGELYGYDRDNNWGATNPFTRINALTAPGVFTSTPFHPTDWRKMAGAGVGGNIVKDKLFWFFAFDWFKRNFPGEAVASNPGTFFATQTVASSTITTLATRLGVTPAQALTTYNNDLAGLNTMTGLVLRTGEQYIYFPKIDWTMNQKNHASFSFNRMRWSSPAGVQTAPTVTRGIASFGNDFVKDTWGVAKLVSLLTNSLSNEVRFQYGRDFEYQFTQPPSPYELANLVNAPTFTNPLGLPPSVSITNGFTFGVPNFLNRPFFPDETRQQLADTVTWLHGNHSLKFGVDFSHVSDNSQNLFNGFGSYSYATLVDYFSDFNLANTCSGKPCYSNFTQGLGLPGLKFNTKDVAFFGQDDWRIKPRLTLSFGLRYEAQILPSPLGTLVNPGVPQTANVPKDRNNFGPRIGFAFDISGKGKTVLRGGYGIYYGRVINSTIFQSLISTGMPGSQISKFFTPTSSGAPVFPAILTGLTGAGSSITFFDSHFQNPQIHQMDMTLEHDLGWGTVLSVSYLGSLGRELPGFVDTNICTGAGVPLPACAAPGTITFNVLGGGPIKATTFTEPLFTKRANPAFGSMTDIISGINSSYHALVVQMNHRMSHNVQFGANYTWSHAIDFGQNQSTFSDTNDFLVPNSIAPEKGNSIYDVRNRFVANAVMTSPWKAKGWARWLANDWEFNPIFQVQNGLPLNLTTSGTPAIVQNNAGVNSLLFGLGSSINGSGGANRIDIVGRNTFRFPATWVGDLRIAKYFTFQEKYKLELVGDFFNLANHQNVTSENSTGYIISNPSIKANVVSSCATGLATTVSCVSFNAPFGVPNNSNSSFVYSQREIQLGVRIQF